MTELDFDELDKAVNSLMAETDVASAPVVDAAVTPTASSVATDDVATPASQSTSVTPQPAAPLSVSPATRRRGQFMDMVHPSSNMRSPSASVSRQANDVTPLTSIADIPQVPTVDEVTSPVDTQPEVVSVTDDVKSDPLVVTPPSITFEVPEPSNPVVASEESSSSEVQDTPVEQLSDEPLNSPFLTDAKVDKRPLGSPVVFPEPSSIDTSMESTAIETPLPIDAQETTEETSTLTPQEADEASDVPVVASEPEQVPESGVAALPDEFSQDVVAIEANEAVHDNSSVTPAEEVAVAPPVASEATKPASGVIVPQYQEQPSTGDQTNGAIYDTSTYHQPLDAKQHKKKPHVLTWILWTLVLLIVGATAGAAWFYFTTQ